MAKSTSTDHYEARVTIELVEKNIYGDILSDNGKISYAKKLKLQNLAGLGYLLSQLDDVVSRTIEMSS